MNAVTPPRPRFWQSRRRHAVHGAPCDWGITFERFRFLAPCQRLRAIVCVLSAHLRDDESSTCVCLRLREQCLRSEITSVSRVANVLLLRFVAGKRSVAVQTFPVDLKHSDCSNTPRNPQTIDLCVLASFSCRVYAETQGRKVRPVAGDIVDAGYCPYNSFKKPPFAISI